MKTYREFLLKEDNYNVLLQEPSKVVPKNGNTSVRNTSPMDGANSDARPYGEEVSPERRRFQLIDRMRKGGKFHSVKKELEDEPFPKKLLTRHDPNTPKIDLREDEKEPSWEGHDPPFVVIFRRKAIRNFPNGKRVALYYSQTLDKALAIPYDIPGSSKDHDLITTSDTK